MRIAKRLNGEIVSADSRLLYKGMDIGTAKPTKRDRAAIPHHLIDVVAPSSTLTLSAYQAKAIRAIKDILRRGKLPILVGGTGLYVRAIVDNLRIPEVPPNTRLRSQLEAMPRPELFRWLRALDPEYAARAGANPRYAIRALEVIKMTGQPFSLLQGKGEPLFDAMQIGINPSAPHLEARIATRVRAMAKAGLVKEVRGLIKKFGSNAAALSGIGYRELFPYLNGTTTLKNALEAVRLHTRHYAKRQMTWFKKDPKITWVTSPEKALALAIKSFNAA